MNRDAFQRDDWLLGGVAVLLIHFGYFAFAFYAAIVLCVALVVIARRANGAPGYVPRIR